MAIAVGIDGNVSFISGHNGAFDRFELLVGQRLLDATEFGDTFEENVGGLQYGRWRVDAKPKYNAASNAPGLDDITGTGGAMTFTVATGCTLQFTGIIDNCGVSSDVGGAARLFYTGVTSGAVTETWDETT